MQVALGMCPCAVSFIACFTCCTSSILFPHKIHNILYAHYIIMAPDKCTLYVGHCLVQELVIVNKLLEARETRMVEMSREVIQLNETNQELQRSDMYSASKNIVYHSSLSSIMLFKVPSAIDENSS